MMAREKAPSLTHSSLPSLREVGRWTMAGVVVMAAHALAAYTIHRMSEQDISAQAAESAMMIELAPLPVAPIEEVETAASEELITEETVDPIEEPVETAEAEPEPVEEEVVEETPPEEVEPEETVEEVTEEPEQEIAEAVTPEVEIPLPQPRPKIVPEKPIVKKEPVKRKPEPRAEPKREVAKAAPRPAPASTATSRASSAPSVSPAKWQSRVLAWLNRHKRYPRSAGGDQGTVSVRFSIDRSGNVISASLSGSSGNADLDQAALDMVRRASPVPAPPSEIAKNRMSLTVPVRFSTR